MKIAICDDDINISNAIYHHIINTKDISISKIDIFATADALLFACDAQNYDLIFMDICLGENSGIKTAERLSMQQPHVQIIFMSGFDDYYLDVYNVEHIYFLKKPVDPEKLNAALATAHKRITNLQNEYFTFSNKHEALRIPLNDIMYLEKSRRLIVIHTHSGEKHELYGKFSDIMERLGPSFHQCHTSYVVNIRHVSVMVGRCFILSDGKEIPVSKKFFSGTKEFFMEYLTK